ncbi:hypothetical protein HanXRQr2_Chr10g0447491 [Helianthus annuus]|uniref:Uncharacterized protein n=1 Tax=Helianthus annuus TaxID=4232 RepID=A0A9K3N4T6_HELAN|nr:hypothetical protein HanXRQr2_Chr10g0447491 [Helianthus annuus]
MSSYTHLVPFDSVIFLALLGGYLKTIDQSQEMMHRIEQDTLRRTWALVTIKDARLVNYVVYFCF